MAEKGPQKGFESAGVFWLHERPDEQLPGTLRQNPNEGSQIALLGNFGSRLVAPHSSVLHGYLDNAPCTLFGLEQSRGRSSYRGLAQAYFDADLLLVGEHVSSLEEPIFCGTLVKFGGLDEWVDFSAMKLTAEDEQFATVPSRVDFVKQPQISARSDVIGGTVTLRGSFSYSFNHSCAHLEHHSLFEVEFDKATSIQALSECVFELQNLFTLLTWRPAPFAFWSLSRLVENDPMNRSGKRNSGLYGRWPVAEDKKSFSDQLTPFAQVRNHLPAMLASWLQPTSAMKSTRHMLTSVISSKGQYLEFKFLALMQTVEAFHRLLDPRTYMLETEYDEVHQKLAAAIPAHLKDDHRDSLKSRIKYGNELSLRTRFKELFLRLPESLRLHICDNFKAFVGQAVDMRNDLTHPNGGENTKSPEPTQMWQASQRIKLLLTILLLNELGIPFDDIEKIAINEDWRSLTRR